MKLTFKENKYYGKDFELTPKGFERLTKAIKKSGVNVYDDDYELLPITEALVEICPNKSTRETCRLDTTLEIIKSIEYLKDKKLI